MSINRRDFIAGGAGAIGFAALGAPAWAATASREFRAYIGSRKVGEQSISLERKGKDLIVRTETDVAVSVLVARHSLRLNCAEVWRDGVVQSISSNAIENGKKFSVRAQRTASGLEIAGTKFNGTRKDTVSTTTFFMPELATRKVWVSTQTGRPIKVSTSRAGSENFQTDAGTFACAKYKCRGDLKAPIDAYYTNEGELAGFVARRFGISLRTVATSMSPKFSTLW